MIQGVYKSKNLFSNFKFTIDIKALGKVINEEYHFRTKGLKVSQSQFHRTVNRELPHPNNYQYKLFASKTCIAGSSVSELKAKP